MDDEESGLSDYVILSNETARSQLRTAVVRIKVIVLKFATMLGKW